MVMQQYDPEMAKRVWSRVQGTAQVPALPELICKAQAAQACYRQLSGFFQGRDADTLRCMALDEQRHESMLKGLCRLDGGDVPAPARQVPVRQAPAALLRQCYSREVRSAELFEKLSSDSRHGPVYAAMAGRERAHSIAVLELLGNMKKV